MVKQVKKDEINTLVSYNRFDIVAKYLYAKELIQTDKKNSFYNDAVKSLYIRHILMRNMGIEGKDIYATTKDKTNINHFLTDFKNLIDDMKTNGYNNEYPIIMGKDGLPRQAAHRIAASLALNIDAYVQEVDEVGISWDFRWFEEKGFTTEDKMRLLKGFIEIHPHNSAIFIIWNPIYQYLGHIKKIINKDLNVVGEVDLDFEENYIAFNNVILDIYETNNLNKNKYETILNKAKLLQACPLRFKVMVVTNQNSPDVDIHDMVTQHKDEIRELLAHKIPKNIFATVHSSDSSRECQHLADTLLSPNNIEHVKMRLNHTYDENFLRLFKKCETECEKLNIDTKEICFVGSAPMTALGLQDFSDLDFVVKHMHRDNLGDELIQLNGVDIARPDYWHKREKDINDDILIDFDDYHFLFNGFKFTNLDITKFKKEVSTEGKNVIHVRQIELFEKMMGYRIQQQMLIKRMNDELARRDLKTNASKIDYYRYKILSKILLGSSRKKYKEKYNCLKATFRR